MLNIHNLDYPQAIKREWRKVLAATLIVVLAALVATMAQPLLYQSKESILILQKSSFSIDAYSASKSEERVATKLSQVVYSSSFLDEVLNSSASIDQSYFPDDEKKRRKKWSKTVEAKVPAGLGKLDIAIYHKDPNQALLISQAVAYVLTARKNEYIGIADVDLRLLDAPLVSKFPVKPNIIANIIFGLVAGFILGILYIIISCKPGHEKYFHSPKLADIQPQLVDYDKIAVDESVEQDMAKSTATLEIEDLSKVEDLENEQQEIPVPSIGSDFYSEKDQQNNEKKELPKFNDEDKIMGMHNRE